jgi:DNA-binding NarL/FixJ family response regulator
VPQIGGPRIPVVLVTDPDGRVGRGTMPRVEAELGDDAPPAQIRAAVLAVAAGLVVSRPEEPDRAVRTRPADLDDEPNVESLTPRELQVLDALALGLSNRAIASRLGLSEHTVKFHVASILGKLEARTRTQAVRRGLARGLLAI